MKGSTSNRFPIPVTASVRLRLTLWYLAVMSLIIFVFGGSLYGSSQTFLNGDAAESQLQAELYQDSQQYAATYRKALIAHQTLTSLALREQELVVLLAPNGRVMTASGPLTTGVIDQLQMRSAQFSGLLDVELPEMHPHGLWQWSTTNEYRILVTPVLNQNARIATLLVGLPQPAPTPLLAIWLFWGTMTLLVAAVGGYWLAGKVLRPVNAITHMANEIEATDLRRRLHVERRDEFGELAATFNHMLGRLEAAFRRQAQLTADASHELRTPLTIMNLEINRALTQLTEPEEYRQVLEQINVENAQMMAMVNGLLLLARADTGKLVLEQCDVDLGDVALASVERLLPLALRSGVALATGELPELIVRGDPRYLGQMLTNLIENGIKYSTGTGSRVWVDLAREGEDVALIRVQDNGPGISKEHLPYLFERFYRADKARARQPRDPEESIDGLEENSSGTGLGLSIVQWIVAAHGGDVHVESVVGSGTLFEVRLPLASAKTHISAVGESPDDTPMTELERRIHVPVISSGNTDTAPISAGRSISKESLMNDDLAVRPAKQQGRAGAPTGTFLTVVVCQALVFLFAATLHTGAFGVPSLYIAMVVEGLCGIACIFSAYTILTRRPSAARAAVIVQILIFLAVLLGLFSVLRDESIRTPINVGLHIVMLALILLGLGLLSLPGTRAGLRQLSTTGASQF